MLPRAVEQRPLEFAIDRRGRMRRDDMGLAVKNIVIISGQFAVATLGHAGIRAQIAWPGWGWLYVSRRNLIQLEASGFRIERRRSAQDQPPTLRQIVFEPGF